ncbi:hypothetical protein AB4Y96_24430 [Phyllobacterium sp. TAF24]|uniref:hypothetical protein n=1 Tax=Phyllobacterium sp. TAF24 TaxID=3233068 RepID=UPI003F9B7A5E
MISTSNIFLRIIACAVIIGAIDAQAASDEYGKTLTAQMLKCLKLPTDAPKSYSLSGVAILKDGIADFVTINFTTKPSESEKAVAALVADAVTQCEPYGSVSGTFKFVVTPELFEAGSKN